VIATVFLGPSMPLQEARTILPGAVYRPPAAQGDLLAAVNQDGANVIGLIDGTFHQTLSVWHSEVCYLLSQGVIVFGASSMGALRAVETERFGTVGLGAIFKWYRDGIITADDEVALVHGTEEHGFRPLSLALVNIRASLNEAVSRGRLASSYAEQAIEIARSLYYPDRKANTILQRCRDVRLPDREVRAIERALTVDYVDLKQADARELLTHIRRVLDGSEPPPERVAFEFSRSSVFDSLYNLDRYVRVGGAQLSLQSIREHAGLHRGEFHDVKRAALNRRVVAFFGLVLGLTVTPEEVAALRSEFLDQRGLGSEEALAGWLRENGMSEGDLSEYLSTEVVCVRLRRWAMARLGLDRGCRAILDEARMRDIFHDWAATAAEQQDIVAAYRHEAEYSAVHHDDPRRLAALHNAHSEARVNGDAQAWAEEVGFEEIEDLVSALGDSAIYYDVKTRVASQLKAMERARRVSRTGAAVTTTISPSARHSDPRGSRVAPERTTPRSPRRAGAPARSRT
jgi:hypothetical protein